VTALEHSACSPYLSTIDSFLHSNLKTFLKIQRFGNAKEFTAKATRTLAEVLKNGFQERFEKLSECYEKCITAQRN
jgi:hypothetical protein